MTFSVHVFSRGPTTVTRERRGELADMLSSEWIVYSALGRGSASEKWKAFPKLNVRDLSPARQELLGQHVKRMLDEAKRRRPGDEYYQSTCYLAALEHFGCRCPHVPMDNSRYAGLQGFISECKHCGAVTVEDPAHREPAKRESPLPPVPFPLSVTTPVAPPHPFLGDGNGPPSLAAIPSCEARCFVCSTVAIAPWHEDVETTKHDAIDKLAERCAHAKTWLAVIGRGLPQKRLHRAAGP